MSHPAKTSTPYLRVAIRHGVVWARQYYGRVFHAKLEDSARASICGATPDRDGKRGRWCAYSKGPPTNTRCGACVELIKQAEEEVITA